MPLLTKDINETDRLNALRSYHILDTAEEKDFDELTELASAICQTEIALISLVDEERQWFKSHTGIDAAPTLSLLLMILWLLKMPKKTNGLLIML